MTRDEAAMKLSAHLMQCGMMMPIEWVEKNGEGSELMAAFSMAISALREQEELARNLHDVASCEQVTEPLQRNGSSDSEVSLATEKQVTSDNKGCEFCNETLKQMPNILAVADYYQDNTVYEPKFCPLCGRRLEEV